MSPHPPSRWRVIGPLRCAFTLLEVLVVLVMLGVVVGMVAPAVTRSAGVRREQSSLFDLTSELALVRLEALRDGASIEVTLSQSQRTLVLESPREQKQFGPWPLALLASNGDAAATAHLRIDEHGRATPSRLEFRSFGTSTRLWTISFDPVGGTPTAHRVTEAVTP